MNKLNYVRQKLQDTAKHAEVSFKTNISIRTLYNAKDKAKKVKDSTIDRLYVYFKGGAK